jgi:hypothetical protein
MGRNLPRYKRHIKFVERMAEEEAYLIDNLSRNLGRSMVSNKEEEAVVDSHD